MRLVLGLISIISAVGLLLAQEFGLRNVAFVPTATTVEESPAGGIQLVNASTNKIQGVGTTITNTFTVSSSANRILLCWLSGDGNSEYTGVTWNSDPMTAYAGDSEDGRTNSLWYIVNPDSGEHECIATYGADSRNLTICVQEWSGVDQGTPLGTASVASAVGPSTITVDVASAAGEIVVDHCIYNNAAVTVGGGQTLIFDDYGWYATSANVASSYEDGSATTTMSWSSADYWITVAVPLKPASP